MLIQVDYWVDHTGATDVTYYGPVCTYTMRVPGTEYHGEPDQPWCRDIAAIAQYLVGTIAPQDNLTYY